MMDVEMDIERLNFVTKYDGDAFEQELNFGHEMQPLFEQEIVMNVEEDLIEYDDEEKDVNVVTRVIISDEKKNESTVEEKDIINLVQSLGIHPDDIGRKSSIWRFNVVHIRGVQDMSSDDVLLYFNDYEPNSIEWVNDLSCNVVFDDEKMAAAALLGLSDGKVVKGKCTSDISDADENVVISSNSLDVPVPPGVWKLGKTHAKSKTLLLRFAAIGDKKMKGNSAATRSNSNRRENTKLTLLSDTIVKSVRKRVNSDGSEFESKRLKVMRMRMRADDEEEKQNVSHRRSAFERLGKQFSPKQNITKTVVWSRLENDSLYDDDGNDKYDIQHDSRRRPRRKHVWEAQTIVNPHVTINDLRHKITRRRI